VARVGRKRGKMNLEKTINKNMFDVSTSIRDTNPVQSPELSTTDQHDTPSTPLSSILSHPKQKLTAQFKRAITMMKQRSEPSRESSPPQLLTSLSLTEKPTYALDPSLLTSLIEEPTHDDHLPPPPEIISPPSQTFVHIKPQTLYSTSNQDLNPTMPATIITMDPSTTINHQNQNLSGVRLIIPSTQQIHPSLVQTITPHTSSSSATLSPTSSSTTTTGDITMLETNF
jgi:hypothetical protein